MRWRYSIVGMRSVALVPMRRSLFYTRRLSIFVHFLPHCGEHEMKNWMALLTVVAATSLGAVGCGAPDNTENSVDPSVTVDEGVTDTPDPTGAGDAGK